MAALTKSRPAQLDDNRITLSSSIPTPFSSSDRDYILHSSHTNGLHHAITPSPIAHEHPPLAQESQVDGEILLNADRVVSSLCYFCPKSHMDPLIQDQHLMPSIARVQASVLSTLNNLLSPFYPQQHPGILDYTHSVLTQPSSSRAVPSTPSGHSPTAALRSLVANLRHAQSRNSEMIQVSSSDDDTALLRELFGYVDTLTSSLHERDAQLVHALVSLLADLNRLSVLGVSPPPKDVPVWSHDASIPNTGNLDSLARQLSEFQLQRHDQSDQEGSLPPVIAVEKALLWVRIDETLETVLNLCHYREEDRPRHSLSDPPQYDLLSHDGELPPNYDPDPELFGSDTKTLASLSYRMSIDEKMRLDLDEVTTAIDRLYRVAPQLHNQRVELKRSKLEELEIAHAAQAAPASLGKQKERELERIVDMIGRASERKLVQQTVILGDMDARIERMRQRDLQKVHFN
jgi:ubiquitin-protein ligase E3 D